MPAPKKQTSEEPKKLGRKRKSVLGRHKVTVSIPGEIKQKFDEELEPLSDTRSSVVQALIKAWIEADPEERARFMESKKLG